MTAETLRCLLLSDFNISNLAGQLRQPSAGLALKATVAPYGQVVSSLLDPTANIWREPWEAAVVWTRPEGVLEAFARILAGEHPTGAELLAEVDHFVDLLLHLRERAAITLIPTWTLPPTQRGLGVGDLRPGGVSWALLQINSRLVERLAESPGFQVLNAQAWITQGGAGAYNPKLWYMAKTPFAPEVFKLAAADLRAALRAARGGSRKLLVIDLDDTLWGGIVGDVGWQSLRVGGHDPLGEAFLDFQQALRMLRRRGILLAICSKNDEAVALEALRQHPDMLLRPDDFVAWRINWTDKAANLAELTAELNLGLQSVVFIDDNPVERARVREALPEVFVPEWPADKMLYRQALLALDCFDAVSISGEDRQRTAMYSAETHRQTLRQSVGSLEDWLRTLEIIVTIEDLDDSNLTRAAQLLNKTNQMNLRTRRLTEDELQAWSQQGQRRTFCLRVADKFGDSGLCGLVSIEGQGSACQIVDFILSCRVFGRGIERLMVRTAVEQARHWQAEVVVAEYLPTEKNRPCLEFWQQSGFTSDNGDRYSWRVSGNEYQAPEHLRVVVRDQVTL